MNGSRIFLTDNSDQFPVFTVFKQSNTAHPDDAVVVIEMRLDNAQCDARFMDFLTSLHWAFLYDTDDVDANFDIFQSNVGEA